MSGERLQDLFLLNKCSYIDSFTHETLGHHSIDDCIEIIVKASISLNKCLPDRTETRGSMVL